MNFLSPRPKLGTQLPPLSDIQNRYSALPNLVSAYVVCKKFEQHGERIQITDPKVIIRARVLGYLLLHAASAQTLHEIVRTINGCGNDISALDALGEAFMQWFIRPFRKHKRGTPVISSHPSRPSFDKEKNDLNHDSPQNYNTARAAALVRDNYRCLVTGRYDLRAQVTTPEELTEVWRLGGAVYTVCAHIIPDSTVFALGNSDKVPSEKVQLKRDYAASVLAVLQLFGYDVDKLNGSKIHSLFNVMTLSRDINDLFDRLALWFEATETPNTYRVVTSEVMAMPPGKVVSFTTCDPTRFPLPSPELLALHATCAKVAHLSGAAEQFDEYDRDADELDVLEPSGGSSEVLTHLLKNIVSMGA